MNLSEAVELLWLFYSKLIEKGFSESAAVNLTSKYFDWLFSPIQ